MVIELSPPVLEFSSKILCPHDAKHKFYNLGIEN